MVNNIKNNKKGFSLIEILFYIALFAVLTVVVINALIYMTKSFKETSVHSDLVQSASIMEKMSREIRQSNNIFSISVSDLTLNTKDELDNNKTIRFVLSGSDVQFYEDGVLTGNLNTPNIQVTNLSFTEITTAQGKAIKISFSVSSTKDESDRVEDFYNTVVLRGGY